MLNRAEVFQEFALGLPSYRPDDVKLIRRCAEDQFVLDLMPKEPTWDVPHRLLSAVQFLISKGDAPDYRAQADAWATFREIVQNHSGWIAQFVQHRPIQTNETQRCFPLLPIFLTVARSVGQPLDLLELGASAGLNLLWDKYSYSYREGTWGPHESILTLSGDENLPVPKDLLQQEVSIRRRRGIDLDPVDVTTDDGFRLLASFLGSDSARLDRLERAAAVARREAGNVELIRGDYLHVLPDLLRHRDGTAVTVVFQTFSTIYLPLEGRLKLREIIEHAATNGPLAWISTPTPEEHGERRDDYPLELSIWPSGPQNQIVAWMSNAGDRLEWMV